MKKSDEIARKPKVKPIKSSPLISDPIEKIRVKENVQKRRDLLSKRFKAAKAIDEFVTKEQNFNNVLQHLSDWVLPAMERAIQYHENDPHNVMIDPKWYNQLQEALEDVQQESDLLITTSGALKDHLIQEKAKSPRLTRIKGEGHQDSQYQIDTYLAEGPFLVEEPSSEEEWVAIDAVQQLKSMLPQYFNSLLFCVKFYQEHAHLFSQIEANVLSTLEQNYDEKAAGKPFNQLRNVILNSPQGPGTGNFSSYFINFVQRAPRYPMQFAEIKKNLEPGHPLYPVISDLERRVKELCALVDERSQYLTDKDKIENRVAISKRLNPVWTRSMKKRKLKSTKGIKSRLCLRGRGLKHDLLETGIAKNKREAKIDLRLYNKAVEYFNKNHREIKNLISFCQSLAELQEQALDFDFIKDRLFHKAGEAPSVALTAWNGEFQYNLQHILMIIKKLDMSNLMRACDVLKKYKDLDRFAHQRNILTGLELVFETLQMYKKEFANAEDAEQLRFLGCPGSKFFYQSGTLRGAQIRQQRRNQQPRMDLMTRRSQYTPATSKGKEKIVNENLLSDDGYDASDSESASTTTTLMQPAFNIKKAQAALQPRSYLINGSVVVHKPSKPRLSVHELAKRFGST